MNTATQPKERPILFNGDMVQAILEGRKTQTRRVVAGDDVQVRLKDPIVGALRTTRKGKRLFGVGNADESIFVRSPYGQPGDRLWVREEFYEFLDTETAHGNYYILDREYYYRATGKQSVKTWVSGDHMPRAASRITLEITDVRVERLKSISADDAIAEGAVTYVWKDYPDICKGKFLNLWESVYGKESTNADPWVWVYEFKKLDQD